MHAAYCDENPKNAETFPCITHRLKATTNPNPSPSPYRLKATAPSSAERERLLAPLAAVSPADRRGWHERNPSPNPNPQP
jgi:hypothetical protein